jgi:hypothetical protein
VLYRTTILALAALVAITNTALPRPAHSAITLATPPDLSADVLALALGSVRCAQRSGLGTRASRLAVIDYSLPSTERRLT